MLGSTIHRVASEGLERQSTDGPEQQVLRARPEEPEEAQWEEFKGEGIES